MMKEPWHLIVIWMEKTIILLKMTMRGASSEYVPCVNYPNDKVYPEDEKNGWVRLDEDTGPPNIYRFEGSCQNYMDLNEFTPGAVLKSFLKIECGQY